MSDTNTSSTLPPALDTLREAAAGLLFPSETDAPLVPFFWPDASGDASTKDLIKDMTPERFSLLAHLEAGAPIKTVSLSAFFRLDVKEESWHNAEEQAEVKRFQALMETIKSTLQKPQVFRVGETSIEVYIVGYVEGGWSGLQTRVVET